MARALWRGQEREEPAAPWVSRDSHAGARLAKPKSVRPPASSFPPSAAASPLSSASFSTPRGIQHPIKTPPSSEKSKLRGGGSRSGCVPAFGRIGRKNGAGTGQRHVPPWPGCRSLPNHHPPLCLHPYAPLHPFLHLKLQMVLIFKPPDWILII